MRMTRASFLVGFAAGFVAGARSGRETYDQIVKYAKTAYDHPTVQQARGTVQTQATGLAQKVSGQLADKVPQMAQSAAHSVGGHIPGMRQRNGGMEKEEGETSAFATSTGTKSTGPSSQPGPNITR